MITGLLLIYLSSCLGMLTLFLPTVHRDPYMSRSEATVGLAICLLPIVNTAAMFLIIVDFVQELITRPNNER